MVRSYSPPISSHSHSLMNKQIHETKLFRLSGSPTGSEHCALILVVFAVLILPVVTFIDVVWSGWEAQLSQSDGDQLQTCGTEGPSKSDQPARNERRTDRPNRSGAILPYWTGLLVFACVGISPSCPKVIFDVKDVPRILLTGLLWIGDYFCPTGVSPYFCRR